MHVTGLFLGPTCILYGGESLPCNLYNWSVWNVYTHFIKMSWGKVGEWGRAALRSRPSSDTKSVPYLPPRASEWPPSSLRTSPVLVPHSPPDSLPHSSSCLGNKMTGHEALFKNCLKWLIRLLGDWGKERSRSFGDSTGQGGPLPGESPSRLPRLEGRGFTVCLESFLSHPSELKSGNQFWE